MSVKVECVRKTIEVWFSQPDWTKRIGFVKLCIKFCPYKEFDWLFQMIKKTRVNYLLLTKQSKQFGFVFALNRKINRIEVFVSNTLASIKFLFHAIWKVLCIDNFYSAGIQLNRINNLLLTIWFDSIWIIQIT